MMRVRSVSVLAMVLVLGAALVVAQERAPRRTRRYEWGMSRGSFLGLLHMEQVQKELKLNEEQLAKVQKVRDDLGAEMRKQYTALREIEDREKRRAKMVELSDQFDGKARKKLHDVLTREQMRRLQQIRMQVRAVTDSLASKDVADKLKLKDEQQKKIAQITKDVRAKRTELFRSMRDATKEQRREGHERYRKLRADADKQALDVLTAEQKKAFEEMKGKKFEFRMRRRAPGEGVTR